MGANQSSINQKNNKKVSSKKLKINKNIEVNVHTSKKFDKLNNSQKSKIKQYVKNVLFLGSSFDDHISKYMKISKVIPSLKSNKLQFSITLKIKKNKNDFNENDLKEHINNSFQVWSQNDPLQLNKKTEFTLPKKNIKKIIVK
jgi:hypothetical protein